MCVPRLYPEARHVEEQIRNAFSDVAPPADDDLAYPGGDDGADLFVFHCPNWGADWKKVPMEVLTSAFPSLCFMSASAFRFYLPAYMLYVLHEHPIGSLVPDHVIDVLHQPVLDPARDAQLRAIGRYRVSALTLDQKRAVLSFLELAQRTATDEELREMAEDAIRGYWAQFRAGAGTRPSC